MTLSKDDASGEARLVCSGINAIEGASARYEYRSDGTGRKFLFITATIDYKEEES